MNENGMPAKTAHAAGHSNANALNAGVEVTCEEIWRAIGTASFAVVSHVNQNGEPRSSGVVYGVVDRRLYLAVAADGWKARQTSTGQEVAVTVPVRRGGILSLLIPIPRGDHHLLRYRDRPSGWLARCHIRVEGTRAARPR